MSSASDTRPRNYSTEKIEGCQPENGRVPTALSERFMATWQLKQVAILLQVRSGWIYKVHIKQLFVSAVNVSRVSPNLPPFYLAI